MLFCCIEFSFVCNKLEWRINNFSYKYYDKVIFRLFPKLVLYWYKVSEIKLYEELNGLFIKFYATEDLLRFDSVALFWYIALGSRLQLKMLALDFLHSL